VKLRKLGQAGLMCLATTVSNWLFGPASTVPAAPTTASVPAAPQVTAANALYDAVQRRIAATHATAARPGVRPPFIPSLVLVVTHNEIRAVSLAAALSGHAGSIVAWLR
jgi:hypothetical protein